MTEWEQCGGIGYSGSTECAEGLECYILTDYYYQCINPENADCLRFESQTVSSYRDWRDSNGVSPVKNQDTCQAWYIYICICFKPFIN